MKRLFAVGLMAAFFSAILAPAVAGTTGNLKGRITDAQGGAPLAGVRVEVNGGIGIRTVTTDATGSYVFLSLQPDTYTVTATKDGYDSQSQPGQSIFADQSSVLNFQLNKTLKTIAVTRSSAGGLVRAGTTSDVYSVNPAQQAAAKALGGSGSLDQAYSAIASVPGVSIPTGQQGWYQSVFIRGGDYDQVGYEFDGLPVLRQSDGAPITTLSVLGQQEVQVYTGGTPATSDSPGLAGYINQVIKTGTYPGYANASLAAGSPAFYHKALVEAGGASPDRTFSYYVGLAGADQSFRYGDQYNGVSNPLYFYPLQVPTTNTNYNILDGSCSVAGTPLTIAPGQTCATTNQGYGLQTSQGPSYVEDTQQDRENVANFHWAIKHHHDEGRDDFQALLVAGNIATQYTTSPFQLGLACNQGGTVSYSCFNGDVQPYYLDASVAAGGGYYSGPLFQTPNQNDLIDAYFPSSPTNRPFNDFLGTNQRDGGVNNYSIEKLQYQKNFNENSYLRAIAYSEYTNWFLNGPNSAFQLYGATLADYEVVGHINGGSLNYSNNLSSEHLLTAQMSYQTQVLQTYNATFDTVLSSNPHWFFENTGQFGNVASNLTDGTHCFNYTSGAYTSCYDLTNIGNQAALVPGNCVTDGTCAGSPAARSNAQWLMTENGQNAQVDNVQPFFTSFSLTDNYRPNEKLTFNIGARFDHFSYALQDLESGFPARQFWFNAFNNEHCSAPGVDPVLGTMDPTSGVVTCPTGYTWMGLPGNGLVNTAGERTSQNVFQPRFAMTYLANPNTVWRASAGVYARPAATSYQEYNTYQQDLPSFLSQFIALGYNSPIHNVRADTSDNYDLSYERHFPGTQLSTKITPFYRSTSNQLQYLAISAIGGVLAGINVGTLHSYGVELSLQDGDFSRDGLSWQLSYTHTETKTRYQSLSNGLNLIDVMNRSIEQYNSYTSACAANESQQICGGGLYAGNAGASLASVTTPGLNVPNPYYNSPTQALMDPSGTYVPYDVIPSAFASGNSYAVPDVASVILNWRRKKFAITPTISFNSGSYYGSPLSVPGYVPQLCSALPSSTPTTPGVSCGVVPSVGSPGSNLPSAIFVPDPYTGKFDSLGALREPWQVVANLQVSYDFTPRLTLTMIANNVFNKCYQRGYAWDTNMACWYSSLPSNTLAPNGPGNQPGAFLTNPPVQLAYPYGIWFNNTQVGITSAIQPFTLTMQLDIKL